MPSRRLASCLATAWPLCQRSRNECRIKVRPSAMPIFALGASPPARRANTGCGGRDRGMPTATVFANRIPLDPLTRSIGLAPAEHTAARGQPWFAGCQLGESSDSVCCENVFGPGIRELVAVPTVVFRLHRHAFFCISVLDDILFSAYLICVCRFGCRYNSGRQRATRWRTRSLIGDRRLDRSSGRLDGARQLPPNPSPIDETKRVAPEVFRDGYGKLVVSAMARRPDVGLTEPLPCCTFG